MCGIPMEPTAEAVDTRRRATFEDCVAHVGGMDGLISPDGWEAIDRNTQHYLWKYPDGHCFCTACGADVGDLRRRHGSEVSCPVCRQAATYMHEARGHKKLFDEFVLYEWRRSVIDPEVIVCTAVDVWHDQREIRPETEPRYVKPTAIYVFRPSSGVTVYKNHRWYGHDSQDARNWHRQQDVRPEHTGGSPRETVEIAGQFARALAGTAIGRVWEAVALDRDDWQEPQDTLLAVANCARRPWLEYLAKSGQRALANVLAWRRNVSRDIVPRPKARTPRELLGLTEAQWFEARRDREELDEDTLGVMGVLRRVGLGGMRIRDVRALGVRYGDLWPLAPTRKGPYDADDPWRLTRDVPMPDKLRRRMWRRLIRERNHWIEWRDYYAALRELGEDMCDPALLLPRDMLAMHDRKIEEARLVKAQHEAQRQAARVADFQAKTLPKLQKAYVFRAAGLVLRPFETAAEIIAEGKALHICIGSYVDRYITGGTVICCLRRAEEPDVPWRAVEFRVSDGHRWQDRGYKNDRDGIAPGIKRQLRAFWAAYDRAHDKKTRRSA